MTTTPPPVSTGPAALADLLLDGMRLLDEQVRQLGDADWARPTPCAGWTTEDLVRHAADTADRGTAFLRGETWSASASADSAAERWRTATSALQALLPSAELDARWPLPADSAQTKLVFVGCDFAVHRWDLAVALGREDELPEGWVTFMDGFFRSLPDEVLRRPRVFDPEVEPQPGDGPTRRLMAFLGRRPACCA